ncbi:heavy-metal-associated domain-containing protein [Maritimibacter sp. UBA3975]|uniref:heavy-metal-associated domain-containing protein n=1 Tax=Maritimibacter sp. UBA3975 TaxID=1946833 RepID=UPI000C0AA3F5|nr:heavy-metal-associated domain-containing protein [Maritimibacter sp. UBA3975]MAM63284.1 heavy metal-binding protein [Maritimibacter sp.]|tara:strand:- start:60062 stop:60262 length:201 start_codon:yes stop_codon:yes gene_type:complete
MTTFSVPEMSCGHCKAKIEDAVLDADEGALIDFDMDAREVDIDSTLDTAALAEAIKTAGYESSPKA